ncbi:hypothetical protein F0L17_14735 [Streptomyces sp. TRM43335]|uniref:Gram-positive cocci surface proteins LPxTG domain-containing protein n=1 Tax=Streptomyces taklimakanensis TaxID=2569853 RepID=A0A6G2BDI7_9ACTN|nr:hypothetical protein [Streptomyces taklimakanensis]MTE20341.1 hypothetical protein [Streptomyces taklimakanensis]
MRPVSLGRALRLGACGAAAAGLVAVAGATPAFAADTLWINAPSELVLPTAADGGEGEGRIAEVGVYHDIAGYPVTDGRLTVDVSGLAGVARVTWPEQCEAEGTTAVCEFPEVSDDPGESTVDLEVRAVEGARTGATGVITYAATAKGAESPYQPGDVTTSVTVGAGPDLVLGGVPQKREAEKGTTTELPFSVANHGNETADGSILWIHASYGLEFAQRFANCEYTETGGAEYPPATEALCVIDQPLEPGASYVPDAPLSLGVTDHALYERTDLRIEPKTAETLKRARGNRTLDRGEGGTLRLVERPSLKSDDLDMDDNYAVTGITVDNEADLELTGAEVDGRVGETVTAQVKLRNLGPAWIADLFAGERIVTVDVRVPEGTTATGIPANCSPRSLTGGYVEKRIGAPRYVCGSSRWIAEDGSLSFPFELRIDEVVPNATGELTVLGEHWAEYDPEAGNNTAVLVVNGDGSGDGSDGGTTGGGDGTQGGDGGTDDGGTDGTQGGDGGTDDGDTAGTGDAASSTGGSGSGSDDGAAGGTPNGGAGNLALTGAGGAALLGGLAVLAVAVGGGLVLVNRRRAHA